MNALFRRRRLSLPCFIGLALIAAAGIFVEANAMSDQLIVLPQVQEAPAVAHVGAGTGTLSVSPDQTVHLNASVSGLGTYLDENQHSSAVVDYYLPQAVSLERAGNRFALSAWCNRATNPYPYPDLRLLIKDARGIVWAFNTRLQGMGALPATDGFEQIETYPYTANELGRVTPWMINRADGVIDEFNPPKAPLELAGFRLIASAAKQYDIALRDISWIGSARFPDPYWLFTSEPGWAAHDQIAGGRPLVWGSDQMNGISASRFGSGPNASPPFLRPADLKLAQGPHRYEWEILDGDEWTLAAVGRGVWSVEKDRPSNLEFPLLAPGTYHLRANVWTEREKSPRQLYACYVVVRSLKSTPVHGHFRLQPSLLFTSSSGSNTFADGNRAVVGIVAPGASRSQTIEWILQDAGQAQIDDGLVPAGVPFSLDLTKYHSSGPAMWLTARLLDDGQVLAVDRRVLGFSGSPLHEAAVSSAVAAKKHAASDARISRTKCDWNEGGTPVVSQESSYLPKFKAWMDDALKDKYTTVEFSAPWYDVEPVPGVFVWGPLDRLADEAAKRGLKVVFRIHPNNSCLPVWLAREYQQDQYGGSNGLWNASSNLVESPASRPLRAGLYRYAQALAAHFRSNPDVIGYTLSNVMFDHGWLDQPYLNQYVDYSDAMTSYFIDRINNKYGSLAKVSEAYGGRYSSWKAVQPPLPQFLTDSDGRLMPVTKPIWRDWSDAKLDAMWASKNAMLTGLRSGDPDCQVGFYADEALPYVAANYVRHDAFVADGSMEMMFPPALEPYRIRYEPIGKIARTAPLVDVGLSNLLAERPGWNSFNNYVFPESRISTLSPTEYAAESRLVEWFSVMDCLHGATLVSKSEHPNAAFLYSMESLLSICQHTFAGRVEDPIKPYRFQAGAEKLRTDWVAASDVGEGLAKRPYVYVPYCADVLTAREIDLLTSYVHNGGRLVLEPTSGYWLDGVGASNAIGKRLGLPAIAPCTPVGHEDSVTAKSDAAMFKDVPVAFRVRSWQPPVETQPTPWIQNIPRAYLRAYHAFGVPKSSQIVARFSGGAPAAYTVAYGKGQILMFCGVVDWLACKGLASAVDSWGRGEHWSGKIAGDPTLIASVFQNHGSIYVVGRRFIGHDEIAKVAGGIPVPSTDVSAPRSCKIPVDARQSYHVRDILNNVDFGVENGSGLAGAGIELNLKAGQGFLLQVTLVGGSTK